MCATRWVENHDGLLRFLELFLEISETLEILSSSKSVDTSTKATALLSSIKHPNFIISLVCTNELFILTLCLCKQLQMVNCDLIEALKNVDNVLEVVKKKRLDAESCFHEIFQKSSEIANALDVEISVPRLNKRQVNRENVEYSTVEEYFRRAIFIPFVDDFISQLEERFLNHRSTISSLQQFLPMFIGNIKFDDISDCLELYLDEEDAISCRGEFLTWQMKWKDADNKPENALETLNMCNEQFFPNIFHIIKILATLPITTATTVKI